MGFPVKSCTPLNSCRSVFAGNVSVLPDDVAGTASSLELSDVSETVAAAAGPTMNADHRVLESGFSAPFPRLQRLNLAQNKV